MNYSKPNSFYFNLIFYFLFTAFSFAQSDESEVIDSFEEYAEAPRETVYVHLNKTTLIKGENLGFSAYVFDSASKELSFSTTNLYCVISDKDGALIKSGLFLVNKGVTSSVFEIDETFKSGEYIFKAYTNWMRNFNEKTYFTQTITVIDTETEKEEARPEKEITKLDVQALPEGGHLLQDVENTLGITVKDQFGKGIPELKINIIDDANQNISTFELNSFGIAKSIITPKANKDYFVTFNYDYKDYKFPIEKAKVSGIALSLKELGGKLIVSLTTNKNTLPNITNKNYIMALHNGAEIEAWEFNFKENQPELNKAFDKNDLYPGVNVFTIFNSENTPLLERVYFNYKNISLVSAVASLTKSLKDSLDITINIPNLNKEQFNSISVSLLPVETKSYNPNEGILSGTYLRPYIKGNIENLDYYFKDISPKKQYELDNLMITQGWSSYNWGDIFGTVPDVAYSFEQGISYKANRNTGDKTQILIQPLRNSNSVLFELNTNEKSFEGASLFPVGTDRLNITEINPKNGKTKKPSLYFTFKPSSIPLLNTNNTLPNPFNKKAILENLADDTNLNEVQKLKEVQLTTKVERTRYESLKKLTRGTIDIFDDEKRNAYTDFATYISSKGFRVVENLGNALPGIPLLQILNTRRNTLQGIEDSPLILLNDVVIDDDDLSILYNFKMDIVDYVEIDRDGASMGMRGAFGVIKIYTDPSLTLKGEDFRDIQMVDFPLKFSVEKDYYTPKYKYYNTPFFNKFGSIGWFSNLKPTNTGDFNIKIPNNNTDSIKLHIEGITNNNFFISETKIIKLNN